MSHQFRTVSEVEQIEESKENLEEDQQLLFVQKDSGKNNANQVGRELGLNDTQKMLEENLLQEQVRRTESFQHVIPQEDTIRQTRRAAPAPSS